MSDPTCAICQESLTNSNEAVLALVCCHSFHHFCINKYCEVQEVTLPEVRCPCCKRTAAEVGIDEVEDIEDSAPRSLARGSASSSHDVPVPTETLAPPQQEKPALLDEPTLLMVEPTLLMPAMAVPTFQTPVEPSESQVDGASAGVAASHPKFDAPSLFCVTCGGQVSNVRCRLVSKRAGTWRCDQCAIRVVQLHRGFGCWPTETFKGLNKEEQQEFFRSLQNREAGVGVVTKATDLLSSHEKHEQFYEFGGEFVPLNVWRTRGSTTSESKSFPHQRIGSIIQFLDLFSE